MKRKSGGFTLVELLVVIGIIALLISILLPTLGRVRAQAGVVACSARMHDVMLAVIMYANENKGALPPIAGNSGYRPADPTKWDGPDANFSLTSYSSQFNSMFQVAQTTTGAFTTWPAKDDGLLLGRVYRAGYLKTPKVFICPSAKVDSDTTGKVGRDFNYYAFNGHTKLVTDPANPTGYLTKFWWKKLPGYGKVNAGKYMVGGGGTNSVQDVSYKPWRMAILIDTLWVDNFGDNQGHKLNLKRAFNLAYPDGSVTSYTADRFTSRSNVANWAGFLDLSNALQDAADGGSIDWRSSWQNKQYNAIPINPG